MTDCNELVPGIPKRDEEEVLWQGQPNPRIESARALGFAFFEVVVLLFLLFMLLDNIEKPQKLKKAFSVTFACIIAPMGVYLLLAPLLAARAARISRYVITTERVAVHYVIFNWGEPIRWETSLSKAEPKPPAKHLLGYDIIFAEFPLCKTDEGTHTKDIGFLSLKKEEADTAWSVLQNAIKRRVAGGTA